MTKPGIDKQNLLFPEAKERPSPALRRRVPLILPRFLKDEAARLKPTVDDQHVGYRMILRWAELESGGHLDRKETSLDADFLNEVFGDALGYKTGTQSPDEYHIEREFTVSGVGSADGALGRFGTGLEPSPVAVIELKDAGTDLDRDKFNGRTPVQQCWDYLNALPQCPWGIVSNFVTIRLYHRDKTPLAFELFTLQGLRNINRFREFYAIFERNGLLPSRLVRIPNALRLLKLSDDRQREVGDDLYEAYSQNRQALVYHLHTRKEKTLDLAIHIAQRLLDRIMFVAFCEDRALLPDKTIKRTYQDLPPFTKVTNPRWRNFLDLFHAVDKGDRRLALSVGFNGGLFEHDSEVDDLELDDDWTDFFKQVGEYDFRDEINVDVLGHLFEKSVTELEKLRLGGLFGDGEAGLETGSRMPKSAKRKRLGIYYTPPAFTRLIVDHAVGEVISERLEAVARAHGLEPEEIDVTEQGKIPERYWRDCLAALRSITVCDPACGSGAFLIQAYDLLEQRYSDVVDGLGRVGAPDADDLAEAVPDMILADNLHGVDLSPEAVEIAQLALWIRSARRGRTLADLSKNIICGNSLVTDEGVDPRAIVWRRAFPSVFSGENGGFDCVIGNPPWERLKVQEREFFSFSAPDIAGAVSAATRRAKIAKLEEFNPELFGRYKRAKENAEKTLAHVRTSGEFPLSARGDINTYALFAELGRKIVAPTGRVGLLTPSGIASDKTTKDFFAALTQSSALRILYDFENKESIFPDVHRSFKFCTLVFGGSQVKAKRADFVFFARNMDHLDDKHRHIALDADDLALMNPNTHTCPIFRSRRDAELTRGIYRRIPVLIDRTRRHGGNTWGIRFVRMFDQTNDAELFHTGDQLMDMGFKQHGNHWKRGKRTFLPLYEAKMVQMYDHRAASVVVESDNWVRQGQTSPTSLVSHQNPEFTVQPRWWVEEGAVSCGLGSRSLPACIAYKDVTSPTNERTMIAAFIPRVGVVNSAPLVLTIENIPLRVGSCLLANLNSFVLDFVARQKVGNVHLNFFIVEQFPMLAPDAYAEQCSWNPRQKLERWVSDRVLKLTCTADDMRPLAEACGMKKTVYKWKPAERARLMAELDAAYFLLYGIQRDDVEYILSTFTGTRRRDEAETGRYTTAELILHTYDEMAERIA